MAAPPMQTPQKPVQNTPTPAQRAMKKTSMTPAEGGTVDDDIVGPNDRPATTHQNQPVRQPEAGSGEKPERQ